MAVALPSSRPISESISSTVGMSLSLLNGLLPFFHGATQNPPLISGGQAGSSVGRLRYAHTPKVNRAKMATTRKLDSRVFAVIRDWRLSVVDIQSMVSTRRGGHRAGSNEGQHHCK